MSEEIKTFTRAQAVTKSDTTVLSNNGNPPDALWIGTAGNVNVQFGDLTTSVLLKNAPAGSILWVGPSRVMSASTTAADIVALWY